MRFPQSLVSLTVCLLPLAISPAFGQSAPPIHPSILSVPLAQASSTKALNQLQRQALTIYQPLQKLRWEGKFFGKDALAYFEQNSWLTGYSTESDLELLKKMGDRQREGRLRAKLGVMRYLEYDFFSAISYYKESLAIAKEIGDHELEGIVLENLVLAYAQNDFFDADVHELMLDYVTYVSERDRDFQADPHWKKLALGNLANFYFGADLYPDAIQFHQKRLDLARQLRDRSGEAKALGDLGVVFQALGESSKAIDYYQQQLQIAEQTQDTTNQKIALGNLGIAYHLLEDYSKAANYQQKRLAIARQTQDLRTQAEALANLAGAYYFLGDYNRAISLYEQGWKISWDRLHDAEILYVIRGNAALAYLQLGQVEKAREYFNDYFRFMKQRTNRRGQGTVKNNAAVLQISLGNLAAAEKALRESIADWESLRSRLGSNDTYKVSIFETQNAPYMNLQSLLLAQNQPEAALEIAERGRARAFAELIAERLSLNPVEQPKTQSKSQIPAPTLEQIRQIAKTHKAAIVEYSILYEDFKTAGKLQSRESELLIWVIQPTGAIGLRRVDLKPLWQEQNTSLETLITNSRESLGVRGRGLTVISRSDGTPSSPQRRLEKLHQLLIQPIADLLPADPNASVIFIPQRSLFLVPFAALQDANKRYLIEQHTILIAPSIQVLELTAKQRQRLGTSPLLEGNSVVVGNPTMPNVVLAAGQLPEPLPSLPGAEKEAKTIAQLLKTKAQTGDDATKTSIVEAMKSARLIHLATHGLLDDFKGLDVPGAIALAPSGQDDGLLTAREILNLKLQAELVVLSACDTGLGKVTGDGVIGLSRSLMVAGVPSVVVSLWSVPDAPTAFLMEEFYKQLQQNPNKAQALRQAMLTTAQKYPNPVNWAAFTLVGEPN